MFHATPWNPAIAAIAAGYAAVCIFVNDDATADTLKILAAGGTRLIALRCIGFNECELRFEQGKPLANEIKPPEKVPAVA